MRKPSGYQTIAQRILGRRVANRIACIDLELSKNWKRLSSWKLRAILTDAKVMNLGWVVHSGRDKREEVATIYYAGQAQSSKKAMTKLYRALDSARVRYTISSDTGAEQEAENPTIVVPVQNIMLKTLKRRLRKR